MNAPNIITELPGPRARALIDTEARVASPSISKEYPLVVDHAEGMVVVDVDGNRFLDFMAGIAVALTGHCHPRVVARVQRQAERLLHICGTDFYYGVYTELCERLAALGPGDFDWRVFLGNSGAEAVEGAVKLARHHTGRQHVIAFYGAFHGRTYGAMSLTASKVKQRAGFGPMLPGVTHMPYGNCLRCAYHLTYPACDVHCVDSWRDTIFKTTLPPEEVAAVIVEPIQGEGGHTVPPPGFFPHLRRLCDDYGILLIADEVQSGMGRTGTFFALEHWDVVPDIITLAKGLGSGMPISAVMAKDEIMTWGAGSHGSTFGGNPVSCAAALATLDLIQEGLMAHAAEMGAYFWEHLTGLKARHPMIRDVRGRGLMIAMEFSEDGQAAAFEQGCFHQGLLVLGCGENAVRLAPPMIVTEEEADTAFEIMDAVLADLD